MKILITGSGGFIGSVLLTQISTKYDVIGLDITESIDRIHTLTTKNTKLISGDILDVDLLDRILEGVNVVIHLAAIVGNRLCLDNPSQAVLVNVGGTHQILKQALKHGIDRFIFTSTQAVYTTFTQRTMPLRENMIPKPDDLYGASKYVSECEIRDTIDYVILRLSNIYGCGHDVKLHGVIGKFVKSAVQNGEISIYGSGEQGVDFVHMDDLLQIIDAIINDSNIRQETFNVGCSRVIKIKKLAQMIAECFKKEYNKDISLRYIQAPPGKIWPDRWLANDKIRKIIPAFPSISLKQGIIQLIKKYMSVDQ